MGWRVAGVGGGGGEVWRAGFLTGCPGWVFRKPLLGKAEDFTIYIKNFIRFPKFNFSKYVGLGYGDSGVGPWLALLVAVHRPLCM